MHPSVPSRQVEPKPVFAGVAPPAPPARSLSRALSPEEQVSQFKRLCRHSPDSALMTPPAGKLIQIRSRTHTPRACPELGHGQIPPGAPTTKAGKILALPGLRAAADWKRGHHMRESRGQQAPQAYHKN